MHWAEVAAQSYSTAVQQLASTVIFFDANIINISSYSFKVCRGTHSSKEMKEDYPFVAHTRE